MPEFLTENRNCSPLVGFTDDQIAEFEEIATCDPRVFQHVANDARGQIARVRSRQGGRFASEAQGWKGSRRVPHHISVSRADVLAEILDVSERKAYYLLKIYRASRPLFMAVARAELSVWDAKALANSNVLVQLWEQGKIRPEEIKDLSEEDVNQILSGYIPRRFQ